MTTALTWTATPFARRLITVTGLILVCALALDRPTLLTLAAAPVAWLAFTPTRPAPSHVTITIEHALRCFEGDPVSITVTADCGTLVDLIRITLTPNSGMRAGVPPLETVAANVSGATLRTALVAPRWGRRPIGHVAVELSVGRRLRRSLVLVQPRTDVGVFPRPVPLNRLVVTSTRYDRSGDHPATTAGQGVEFHSIRPFTSGDRPRRVNWPVSSRRGSLYVTTTRAERTVDVVIAVDVLTDAGPPGRSSRDLALRGAAGVAQIVLRAHDRVGLVAVGGRVRWLTPALGERQLYRVAEAILDVVDWRSYLDPDVDAIPYTALPAGAHIVYFSPLLDQRGVAAAITLRGRGHPVTVVDVCTSQPSARTAADLVARRLWLLDRVATRHRLAELGVTVASWDGESALDALLTPLLRPAVRVAR